MKKLLILCLIFISVKIMSMSFDDQIEVQKRVNDAINAHQRNLFERTPIVTIQDAEKAIAEDVQHEKRYFEKIKNSERLSEYLQSFANLYRQKIVDCKLKSWIDLLNEINLPVVIGSKDVERYINELKKNWNIPDNPVYQPLLDAYKGYLTPETAAVATERIKLRVRQMESRKRRAMQDSIQELTLNEFNLMERVPLKSDFIYFFEATLIPKLQFQFGRLLPQDTGQLAKNVWEQEKAAWLKKHNRKLAESLEVSSPLSPALLPSEYVELQSPQVRSPLLKPALVVGARSLSPRKNVVVSPESNQVIEIPIRELLDQAQKKINSYIDAEIQTFAQAWQKAPNNSKKQEIINTLDKRVNKFTVDLGDLKELKHSQHVLTEYAHSTLCQKLEQKWHVPARKN
jgi:hypothetical protein